MIFPATFSIGLLALTNGVLSTPVRMMKRDDQIIGYRRVSKEQADNYNSNGLTYDGMRGEAQIGEGVYTAYDRDIWEVDDNKDWYCVIRADSDAMNRVSKAWVPHSSDGEELWYDSARIDNYIKRLEDSWDPAKTIRLAIIDGYDPEDLQLLIPPALVSDGSMGLKVECKENQNDVENVPVNYDDWQDNIKGSRT